MSRLRDWISHSSSDYFRSANCSTQSQLSWRAASLRQSELLANAENKSSIPVVEDRFLNLKVVLSHNSADSRWGFYNQSALKSITSKMGPFVSSVRWEEFAAKWRWIAQVLQPDSFGSAHLGEHSWILKTTHIYGVRNVAGNTSSTEGT